MQFTYAEELKNQFAVYGHFYDLDIDGQTFNCRSVLEIASKSIDSIADSNPCAVVVMMNPGSSKPADNLYIPKKYNVSQITSESWEKEVVPTKPDNAQYQIMRLMLLKGWKHVRILNLSDLRNGNSGDFSIEFQKSLVLDPTVPHSILSKKRHTELLNYCSKSGVVIAAWGSTEVLREAAEEFLNLFKKVEGLPLEKPWYRYPSPYKKDQKLDWLKAINEKLKHNKSSQGTQQSCVPA